MDSVHFLSQSPVVTTARTSGEFSLKTVFVMVVQFWSWTMISTGIVLLLLGNWHWLYLRIRAAMMANSPRVILSSCQIFLSSLCLIISISIHFFAYPYQYGDVSGIGLLLSKTSLLSVSFQRFARLRRIAAASIRVIVFSAQNGILIYCLPFSQLALPLESVIYHWVISLSSA